MRRALGPVLVVALWAAPGSAQTLAAKECDPDDPKRCSQPLQAGQAAPFSGQLLTPALAIDLGQRANGCDDRIALEVERERALAAVQKTLDARLLVIEREAAAEKIAALQKALDAMKGLEEPPAWYERPPVVAAATVVVTVGVFALAVKTVELVGQ